MGSLELVKNKFLTHIVNFGVGFSFPKSSGSSFSVSGSGSSPLYQVCPDIGDNPELQGLVKYINFIDIQKLVQNIKTNSADLTLESFLQDTQ